MGAERKCTPDPTPERLNELLEYDPDTGVLRWRTTGKGRRLDRIAGGFNKGPGYLYVGVDGSLRLVHRVIWAMVTGEWPTSLVDHINLDKLDNRWANLRAANPSESCANRAIGKGNTSGFKGVTRESRREVWVAQIVVNRKHIHLGRFDDPEQAHAAYVAAAARYFGEFARTG
jgi:hypothetical protein